MFLDGGLDWVDVGSDRNGVGGRRWASGVWRLSQDDARGELTTSSSGTRLLSGASSHVRFAISLKAAAASGQGSERAPIARSLWHSTVDCSLLRNGRAPGIVTATAAASTGSIATCYHCWHYYYDIPIHLQHTRDKRLIHLSLSPSRLSPPQLWIQRPSQRGALSTPPPTHRALHAQHSLCYHSLTPDSPFTCTSLHAHRLNRMPQLSLVGDLQRGAGAPSTAEHPPPAAASGRPRRRDHVHATAA